jgi:hypothetical protein
LRAVIETELREDLVSLSSKPQQNSKYYRQWSMLLDDPNSIQAASAGTYLLTTSWNQSNPYNYYCPAASGGPDGRAYAGCGPVAMAQILRYHCWPAVVTMDHTYTDYAGACTGTHSISDAGMGAYDWANMPTSITSFSAMAQIQAVGQLIYHCAVGMEADFEAGSTSTYNNFIAPAFQNYFNYTCDEHVYKDSYTTADWYNKIVADIDAGKPIFYTMWEADYTDGHAVVCDGYDTNNMIHLNLGWSGAGTAWYNVDSVSYSGYTWTIHGGVFNIAAPAYGSLTVTLSPQYAIDSGAQWRRTGTAAWHNSGDIETDIPTGSYTIEFKTIVGWIKPTVTNVVIAENQTSAIAASYVSSPQITIGTGISTGYYPLASSRNTARTQTIYPADEIGGDCTLYALALNVASTPGQTLNDFTIRLKHTDLSYYTTASWESTDWTIVYQTSLTITTTGWTEFVFSTPFEYNGVQNLMIDISFENSSSSTAGYCYYSTAAEIRTLRYRTNNTTYGSPLTWSGSSSPSPTTDDSVSNIRLTIASKTPDLTRDGIVNLEDFAVLDSWWLSGCYMSNNWCDGADLDWSGQLDLADLKTFSASWLENM